MVWGFTERLIHLECVDQPLCAGHKRAGGMGNSRQGEHQRHRDLTEHGKLEAIKGEWSIGHKQRKEDESRRQGNNSMEFRHGYSSVSNGGPMKDSKCDYNMF